MKRIIDHLTPEEKSIIFQCMQYVLESHKLSVEKFRDMIMPRARFRAVLNRFPEVDIEDETGIYPDDYRAVMLGMYFVGPISITPVEWSKWFDFTPEQQQRVDEKLVSLTRIAYEEEDEPSSALDDFQFTRQAYLALTNEEQQLLMKSLHYVLQSKELDEVEFRWILESTPEWMKRILEVWPHLEQEPELAGSAAVMLPCCEGLFCNRHLLSFEDWDEWFEVSREEICRIYRKADELMLYYVRQWKEENDIPFYNLTNTTHQNNRRGI